MALESNFAHAHAHLGIHTEANQQPSFLSSQEGVFKSAPNIHALDSSETWAVFLETALAKTMLQNSETTYYSRKFMIADFYSGANQRSVFSERLSVRPWP